MESTVFVGAGYGDGAPDGVATSGLFRLSPDTGEWISVTKDLPFQVEVRAIARLGADRKRHV